MNIKSNQLKHESIYISIHQYDPTIPCIKDTKFHTNCYGHWYLVTSKAKFSGVNNNNNVWVHIYEVATLFNRNTVIVAKWIVIIS